MELPGVAWMAITEADLKDYSAMYLLNPASMSLLWTRSIGVKLLYAAGVMTVSGALIIRKIVNMDV